MKNEYKQELTLSQNSKGEKSLIIQSDTIRGCKNACKSCFAEKLATKSNICFDTPVKVLKLKGKIKSNIMYRFGTAGDPATCWNHSENLIKAKWLNEDSKNMCIITKLQSIEGFTGYFNNLQVSVDPLNKAHFFKTLRNVKILTSKFNNLNIVLRIRSTNSNSYEVQKLQKIAIKFANLNDFKVLETLMRFTSKQQLTEASANTTTYKWERNYYRFQQLSNLEGVKRHFICDSKHLGCAACNLCKNIWKTK